MALLIREKWLGISVTSAIFTNKLTEEKKKKKIVGCNIDGDGEVTEYNDFSKYKK
jgi:hypothetical protein